MKNNVYTSCVIFLVVVFLGLYYAENPEATVKTEKPLPFPAPGFFNATFVELPRSVVPMAEIEQEVEISEEAVTDEEPVAPPIPPPPSITAITYTTVTIPLKQTSRILAPIPEPETYMMLLTGLGFLAGIAQWKSHRKLHQRE